ncbi:hypothetical protein [Pantoea coffeiphila]|uniref:hypothetical protein n=1 Tax=Pantoea coffeiphila TaxID=1465635 RepID=UPI001961C1BC|nr:hypothetical protein [Pantoea coffeiphila]MBM7346052.1 glucokinase [Pantoea coffeiphila]
MDLEHDFNVDDFFKEIEGTEGKFKVDRKKVRFLAENQHQYILDIELSGGNKHAAELDVNDVVAEMLANIMKSKYSDLAADFSGVLTEEKMALTNHDLDISEKTYNQKLQGIEKEDLRKLDIVRILPWIGAVFVVLLLFGFLK